MSELAKQKQTKKRQKSSPKSQKSAKKTNVAQRAPQKSEKKVKKLNKPAQVIDLDERLPEVTDEITRGLELPEGAKPSLTMRLHALNVRRPWLKVLLLLILATSVAVGVEELLRHNVSQPVSEPVAGAPTEMVEPETKSSDQAVAEVPKEAEPEKSSEKLPNEGQNSASEAPVSEPPVPVQNTGRKLVALTFDDGPSVTQTPRLLQILREKGVKATFFVVGNMAQKAPDVLRQEEAEGHEVGSHTMTHANLNRSTLEGIQWEVAAINTLFTDVLGHKPTLMRPPYGNINNNVRTYANLPLILWAVDPEDWKYKDAAIVRRNVVYNTFDGAIVLMHDIHATTVDAVAGIIDDLRAAGYEFLTVSELAAARGVKLQNGVSYGSFRP